MVILTDDAGATRKSKLADAAGVYEFTAVPPGSYTLKSRPRDSPPFRKPSPLPASVQARYRARNQPRIRRRSPSKARIDPYNVVPSMPTQSIFGSIRGWKTFRAPSRSRIPNHAALQREDRQRYRGGVYRVRLPAATSASRAACSCAATSAIISSADSGEWKTAAISRRLSRPPITSKSSKAPPSPIYGGGRVGGFLNFIPKSTRSESAKWLEHVTGKYR